MHRLGRESPRRESAPGTYGRAEFAFALLPLFTALGLHEKTDEHAARAQSIAGRLFDGLGKVYALEDVYDVADYLGEIATDGHLPIDAQRFVFDSGPERLIQEAGMWRRRAKDHLRHKGYPPRSLEARA